MLKGLENLAEAKGEAGLRLCIPQHLLGLFKMFEVHGGKLKKEFGAGLKRSIKYEDSTMSLAMDVRLPEEQEWIRLTHTDIVKITRDRTERESVYAASSGPSERGKRMRQVLLRSSPKKPVVVSSDEEESIRIDIGCQSAGSA